MVAKSHLRGHPIEHNGKEWVYCDTKESTVKTNSERACGHCGKHATSEGHDACLGTLPWTMNACCGHGHNKAAYIQFSDGGGIRGNDAITVMEVFKKYRE